MNSEVLKILKSKYEVDLKYNKLITVFRMNVMKDDIKIKKQLNISGVVITSDNIRELAQNVYDEFKQDSENDSYVNINFILKSSDGTQYESKNMDIFSNGGLITARKIISTEINYINSTEGKSIFITIQHTTTDSYSDNNVYISGYGEFWVNGFTKKIEDNITSWKQQEKWPKLSKWPLVMIFTIGFALLFLNIVGLTSNILDINLSASQSQDAAYSKPISIILSIVWASLVGIWPSQYIVNKIGNLYPSVEFSMGPEHLRIEAGRRKQLSQFVAIGVVPLILSLLI